VRRTVNDKSNTSVVCEISLAEVAAGLAQARRSQRLGGTLMSNTYRRFRTDLRQLLFIGHPATIDVADLAAQLAMRRPLKGCDALQVASALMTESTLMPKVRIIFVSGDDQALRAAQAEGLLTGNPFDHIDEDQIRSDKIR